MGITTANLDLLESGLKDCGLEYEGLCMCELGNQRLFLDSVSEIPHRTSAKGFFKNKGVKHTSIDMNGEDGALPLDLSQPLAKYFAPFDVVTNFGTSEHVSDFYGCLQNIHDLCHVGGMMIHANPHTGHWPEHGLHYVGMDTFDALARLCGYEIKHKGQRYSLGNTTDGMEARAVFLKVGDVLFPTREQFREVPVYPS